MGSSVHCMHLPFWRLPEIFPLQSKNKKYTLHCILAFSTMSRLYGTPIKREVNISTNATSQPTPLSHNGRNTFFFFFYQSLKTFYSSLLILICKKPQKPAIYVVLEETNILTPTSRYTDGPNTWNPNTLNNCWRLTFHFSPLWMTNI